MAPGRCSDGSEVGKALGDVLAGARIEPRLHVAAFVAARDRLHADAVPFPFGDEVGGIEVGEIRILDRMRQHHRAERRGIAIDRLVAAALQPGEQVEIGRRQPRPDQFDLVRVLVAERGGGGLRQPRRNADPHRAGDEFQQRPAAGLVEFVEPARELFRQLGLAERAQRGDDFGQGGGRRVVVADWIRAAVGPYLSRLRGRVGSLGRRVSAVGRYAAELFLSAGASWRRRPTPTLPRKRERGRFRPHQRDRLGEIADIVIGQPEQHRIGAIGDQIADQPRLGVLERQRAGQRRQRVAAVGIGGLAKIGREQPQLVVAAGLVGEAVEQFGEAVHASASSAATASCLFLVAIADEIERPRGKPARLAPMHQRVFLAVGDPDLAGAGRLDGRGQAVPVGMIGDHQRQFDAALAGARAHPHPARGEGRDRIGKAPRPDVRGGRRRRQRDGAGEIGLLHALDRAQLAERDATAFIVVRDLLHRAVQIDRRVVAGLAQQRDHALRLAERIGADQMRALRKQRHRRQQLLHLVRRIAMAEHRQAERRLGDEDVAGHHFERRAGRIGARPCSRRRRRCRCPCRSPRSAPSPARGRPDGI